MSGCRMSTTQAADSVHGRLHGPGADVEFDGVGTDTRSLQPGQLFIALRGPNFDGHDFAAQAAQRGAAALMVDTPQPLDLPQIVVDDTQQGLARLAAAWRGRFEIPLVAITGSNGKTTVKEMLAAIFAQSGPVCATRGNLNNEIGVPLTLLGLEQCHHAAVIEQGASKPGDIAYLTRISAPTVALVTNAGGAHLEGFGDLDTVARTKGEIFEHLPAGGTAVINADDPYAAQWRARCGDVDVVSFGLNARQDERPDVWTQWQANGPLHIHTPRGELSVQLALAGRHNAANALAATAAALAAGVDLAQIGAGLQGLQPVPGRLQWKAGINGARILDDSYNANPASLAAALEVLAACPGDRCLALGDMAELGDAAVDLHQAAGRQARRAGVHRLYATGEHSRHAVSAFGEQAWHFPRQADMVARLRQDLRADSTLLVKGSRSAHMERVVDALLAAGGGGEA